MKQIGAWYVGDVGGNLRRAFCRTESGECFAVTQPRGGGAFTVVTFKCSAEIFEHILQAGGELPDADALGIELQNALQVPAGLADALPA